MERETEGEVSSCPWCLGGSPLFLHFVAALCCNFNATCAALLQILPSVCRVAAIFSVVRQQQQQKIHLAAAATSYTRANC
jgi:hypothetical protein